MQNCPEGQVLWGHGTNAGKCVRYYCGENGDHDPNGNCIPCSEGKYLENGGSCEAGNQGISNQLPATSGTTSCSYIVPDPPSLVPQGQFCYSLTCWAAALTMMLSYRDHHIYTVDAVTKMFGQNYVDKANNNQGLSFYEFVRLGNSLGLIGQSSQFLDPDSLKDMLQKYGQL